MISEFKPFALLENGCEWIEILCDGWQHFLVEHRKGRQVLRRRLADDPKDFHHLVRSHTREGWRFCWTEDDQDPTSDPRFRAWSTVSER